MSQGHHYHCGFGITGSSVPPIRTFVHARKKLLTQKQLAVAVRKEYSVFGKGQLERVVPDLKPSVGEFQILLKRELVFP